MKFVDHIIILNSGAIQVEGTYKELRKKGINFNTMKRAFMEQVTVQKIYNFGGCVPHQFCWQAIK